MALRLKLILPLGSALFALAVVGGVGVVGTYGSFASALEVARQFQAYRARTVKEKVATFFATVEDETSVLYELFESDPAMLEDETAGRLLTALVANLDAVRDLTLVRRDASNVMAYHEDGDVTVEYNGELDDESIEIMRKGRPGDDSEGFEDLYLEPTDKRPVISYTLHLADTAGRPIGTIYLDLDTTTLSEMIVRERSDSAGYLFLVDRRGVVMAHPELVAGGEQPAWDALPRVETLADPVPAAVMAAIKETGAAPAELRAGGRRWLIAAAEVPPVGDSPWYVVSVVPRSAVLGGALERARTIGFLGLVALAVAIGVSLWVARLITAPVSRLAEAANAIREFELELPPGRTGPFEELNRAEGAFAAMLRGLQVFARYVPKTLVRQLVRLEADGGGVRPESREVTILFTDIAGYTSIASAMESEPLAGMLNEYFTVLTRPVLEQGGTVDKFIGDALMAFWNAPLRQPDHADRAIAAALGIRQATAALNRSREAGGLPPLATRIGVHTGTVLVGNIGAEERLNYTIVGDAVNTAARLEALGKEIGLHLCISAETRAAATGSYDWREVATVTLRGREEETRVYTLEDSA